MTWLSLNSACDSFSDKDASRALICKALKGFGTIKRSVNWIPVGGGSLSSTLEGRGILSGIPIKPKVASFWLSGGFLMDSPENSGGEVGICSLEDWLVVISSEIISSSEIQPESSAFVTELIEDFRFLKYRLLHYSKLEKTWASARLDKGAILIRRPFKDHNNSDNKMLYIFAFILPVDVT